MVTEIDRLLREGVQAIKKGDKAAGKAALLKVIERDDMHEQAWLWLSAAVDEREERIICLENVLTINPDNEMAKKGLRKLSVEPSIKQTQAGIPDSPNQPDPIEPEPQAPATTHGTAAALESENWRSTLNVEEKPRSTRVKRAEQRAERRQKEAERAAAIPQAEARNILDLFEAWFAALTFQERHLLAEMRAADPLRVSINILFSVIVSGGLGIITFIMLSGQAVDPAVQAEIESALAELQQSGVALSMAQLMGVIGVIAAFGSVIGVVINAVFLSITTHVGARMLGGDGEFIQTAHAVTIAIVAQQIVGLVPSLLAIIFQIGTGVIGIGLALYNVAVASVTLSAAHTDFGIGKSFVSYIIGAIVGVIFVCVFACGLGLLLGVLSGV